MSLSTFFSRAAIALAATAVVGVVVYLGALILPAGEPATCVATGCFCEPASGVIPTQFEASFSSLAFVLLGVWVIVQRGAAATRERTLLPLAGIVMIAIGASSFLYHATLSFVGQWLDLFSMYLFALLLGLGALWRAGRLRGRPTVVLFVVLVIVLAVAQSVYPDARRVLFALVMLPGAILELTPYIAGRAPGAGRWMLAAIATFVLAFLVWGLDQTALCDPTSWLQGHAVWHVLSAVAALLITVHWRRTSHPV